MENKSMHEEGKKEIFVKCAGGFTVLLCPLTSLLLCGFFEEVAKYVGLLCLLLNVILIVRYRTYRRFDVLMFIAIIMWAGGTSIYTGVDPARAFGCAILRNWYIAFLFYQTVVVTEQPKKDRYFKIILATELFSLSIIMATSIFSSIGRVLFPDFEGIRGMGRFVNGRLSTFGNANMAGPVCTTIIFLSLFLFVKIRTEKHKVLWESLTSLCFLIGLVSLSLTRSRGSIVAAAFGAAVFAFVLLTDSWGKNKIGAFFVSIILFVAFVAVLLLPRELVRNLLPEDKKENLETYEVTYALDTLTDRTIIWPTEIDMLREKPERLIYGMTCAYSEGNVIRDVYDERPELVVYSAHSMLLQQLVSMGIVGFVFATSLVLIWVVTGLRCLFSREKNPPAKMAFALGFGALTFGLVESYSLPYSFLCPLCIALMVFEGYGMSEMKKETKAKTIIWGLVVLICISIGLSWFAYESAKSKKNEYYSRISPTEQNQSDFVRLNNEVSSQMMEPEFWLRGKENTDKELKTYADIIRFNDDNSRMIVSGDAAFSLYEVGESFYYKTAIDLINDTYFVPERFDEYYLEGNPTNADYWEKQKENLGLEALTERITTRFGFSVTRTTLKRYPTDDKIYKDGDSLFFDQMVQSDIQPFMPVAVLHESKDGNWFYVIAYGYGGWIKKTDIALCKSREEWLEKQNPESFLVVTGRELKFFENPYCPELSGLSVPMGTVLPIVSIEEVPKNIQERAGYGNYIAKLFYRGEDGYLIDEYVLIPMSEDVSLGYLPYTQQEIAKLMFKYLGVVYGWAGDNNSVDCSLYVRQVYKCFGFEFPRVAKPQSELYCEENNNVERASLAHKIEILKEAPIGTLMYFPGHVMMYIGMAEGEPYCISSVGDYSTVELGTGNVEAANTVIITNMLDTTRGTGESWLESVERIVIP